VFSSRHLSNQRQLVELEGSDVDVDSRSTPEEGLSAPLQHDPDTRLGLFRQRERTRVSQIGPAGETVGVSERERGAAEIKDALAAESGFERDR